MDISPCTITQVHDCDNENSIFKSLLTQIEMEITSPERKPHSSLTLDDSINPFDLYAMPQQNYQPHIKGSSEWVWTDEIDQEIASIPQIVQEIPHQTAQLKRVQSMRMQQQQKLSQIIRLNNLINEEQDAEHGYDIKQTMGLSPRKKKRIDKDSKNRHQQTFFWSHNVKKVRTSSMNQID